MAGFAYKIVLYNMTFTKEHWPKLYTKDNTVNITSEILLNFREFLSSHSNLFDVLYSPGNGLPQPCFKFWMSESNR